MKKIKNENQLMDLEIKSIMKMVNAMPRFEKRNDNENKSMIWINLEKKLIIKVRSITCIDLKKKNLIIKNQLIIYINLKKIDDRNRSWHAVI